MLVENHEWHKWFAWYPVTLTLSNKRVWLCYVYRRAKYKTFKTVDNAQQYEYGTILCVLSMSSAPGYQR